MVILITENHLITFWGGLQGHPPFFCLRHLLTPPLPAIIIKTERGRFHEYPALLSNEANYTVFRFGDKTIRFRAPYSLERYTGIQEWDHGYLVVLAKYRHDPNPEEEYIDLVPILKNLYFDPDEFLAPIKGVKLANG